MNRPNILWLTYEDTSPQFVSCYGQTPVVTTPHIDALASKGVIFNHAYATAPVCSASRSALITGVCNERTGLGHHRSKYPIPRELIKGFPWYLKQAGYYTTNCTKTDYNIEEEATFISETWDESSREAHWKNRAEGQPFFAVFNYDDSHQSRTMTQPWKWYQKHVLDQLNKEETIDEAIVELPPFYNQTEEMKHHLSRVYNSLKLCDRKIGNMVDEIKEAGLFEDTIIFSFSDHGEGIPRGKCNGIGFGYRASFILHVPEKYAHLSPWGAGTVTDELVSFEDLAPTILSIAGVEIPEVMTGRPIMGEKRRDPKKLIFASRNRLDDTPDLCRSAMDGNFVYTRVFMPHFPSLKLQKYSDVGEIQQAIRRDHLQNKLNEVQAEMLLPQRPTEYLFKITDDSWEINNLSHNPQYRDDLFRMREATLNNIIENRDVMFLPEVDMIKKSPSHCPYEDRKDDTYNPIEGMLEVAMKVDGSQSSISNLIPYLSSESYQIRYWAAVGLFAARHHSEPYLNLIMEHLEDEEISVAIELAATIYTTSRDSKAKDILMMALNASEYLTALQALQKIIYEESIATDFSHELNRIYKNLSKIQKKSNSLQFFVQHIEVFNWKYNGGDLYYPPNKAELTELNLRNLWNEAP